MLDQNLKNQVKGYLQLLEREVVISISLDDSENSKKLRDFVDEVVSLTDKIKVEEADLKFKPSFSLSSGSVMLATSSTKSLNFLEFSESSRLIEITTSLSRSCKYPLT